MLFEILQHIKNSGEVFHSASLPLPPCTTIGVRICLYVRGLTNENASHFLINQSKTKTFIALKVTRKPKPTKKSTRPYFNEIPEHSIHEIRTKAYDVIGVNVFHIPQINEIPPQKRIISSIPYYCYQN